MKLEKWNIKSLEKFFKGRDMPVVVRLDQCTVITDTQRFVDSSFSTIKAHDGEKTYRPYYERLILLKNILNENSITPV